MKKFVGILSLLSILLTVSACDNKTLDNKEYNVNIISVNDLHGALYEEDGHKSMAHLKAEIDAIENEDNIKNTIVIGNGDMFQGTAISNLSHGRTIINAMNECGFDVLGIGNHEFDWGIDEVLKYFDGDLSNGESNAKLVNSNIYKNNKLLDNTVPYTVIDLGFIKVGVVSYAPYQLKRSILKSRTDGYDFRDIEIMNKVMKDCKKHSDIIVANMHYGEAPGDRLNVSLMNYGADAIINGHSHKKYKGTIINPNGVDVPVVQNRDQLKETFGLIRLKVKNGKVIDSYVENRKIGYKEDPQVLETINNDYKQYKDIIEEELCIAKGYHNKADYVTWATRLMQESLDVDCGIMNSGGIRNVKIHDGDIIKYSDVFNIMPFDNKVYIFELTGEELEAISYERHIRDGLFIENEKTYKVAIIDYVALKYSQLEEQIKNGTGKEAPFILRDMFVNELREHGKNHIKFNPQNNILTSK